MEIIIKKCLVCEKVIAPKKKSNLKTAKYCSKSCCSTDINRTIKRGFLKDIKGGLDKRRKYIGEENPNYRGGGMDFSCLNCLKSFKVAIGQITAKKHSGKYCTQQCRFEHKALTSVNKDQVRINKMFRCGFSRAIRNKNFKDSVLFKYLDYSYEDLRKHIESLFVDGMTWDNNTTSGWHIDHVKPMSYFTFSSYEDKGFKECWSLKNLQPLWSKDNLTKGGKNTKINQKKYGIKQ